MNDEELIKELLKDPTVAFEEAERMAAARVAASSRPSTECIGAAAWSCGHPTARAVRSGRVASAAT